MWRVIRTEFAYIWPWLLAAWAIAIGVAVMVNGLVLLVGEDHPGSEVAIGLPGIFMVIAAMVVAFIAQGMRSEERRTRLLLTGPFTPRQLGAAMVLLPAFLVGLGVLVSALYLAVASFAAGQLDPTPVQMIAGVAGQMFAIVQMGPLAQESSAARRQQRSRAAMVGWTVFVVAILLLAGLQAVHVRFYGAIAQVTIAVTVMIGSAVLFNGRTDFTR